MPGGDYLFRKSEAIEASRVMRSGEDPVRADTSSTDADDDDTSTDDDTTTD